MKPVYRGLCLLLYSALLLCPFMSKAQFQNGPERYKYLVVALSKGSYDIMYPDSKTPYQPYYSPEWKRASDTLVWLKIDNEVWKKQNRSITFYLRCNGKTVTFNLNNLTEFHNFLDLTGVDICGLQQDYVSLQLSRPAGNREPYPAPRLYFRADGFDHVLYHTLNAYDITGELYKILGNERTAMMYRSGDIVNYYYK